MQNTLISPVIFLTLVLASLSGCAAHGPTALLHPGTHSSSCKTHAYVKTGLHDYITQRFPNNAQVRVAIVPFTVPANFSGFGPHTPNVGQELALKLQAELLRCSNLPIVEILNRADWPGKKEEFFTGNFGAISQAREAGYDLVVLGLVEPQRSLDQLIAYTKIIEADAGITLWYGRTTANISKPQFTSLWYYTELDHRRPDLLYVGELFEQSISCMTEGMIDKADMAEQCLPEDYYEQTAQEENKRRFNPIPIS